MSAPTPVEVWAPAFAWLDSLTIETTQTVFADGRRWCRLCEQQLPAPQREREQHVREHVRERSDHVRRQTAAARRKAAAGLRAVNRERRLQARLLGDQPARSKR